MAKVALLMENCSLLNILKVNFLEHQHIEITHFRCAREYIKYTNSGSTIDIVISPRSILKEQSATIVYNHIQNKNHKTKMLLVGGKIEGLSTFSVEINSVKSWRNVISDTLSLVKSLNHTLTMDYSQYIGFDIEFFREINKFPVDAFIKLTEKEKNTKYVKRFNAHADIEFNVLNKYIESKIEKLYIKREDSQALIEKLTYSLTIKTTPSKLGLLELIEHSKNYFQITHNYVNDFGLSELSVQAISKATANLAKSLEKYAGKSISIRLKKVLENNSSFRFKNSYLTSVIACKFLKLNDWSNASQVTDIAIASFMQDIALENDSEALISTKEELDTLLFENRELYEKINSHASISAEYAQKIPNISSTAIQLISQHHGSRNGVGFKDYLNSSFSQISIIFYLSEKISRYLISCHNRSVRPDLNYFFTSLANNNPSQSVKKQLSIITNFFESKGKKSKKSKTQQLLSSALT